MTTNSILGTSPGALHSLFNTTNHLVINVQDAIYSPPVHHNALATKEESGYDGTSMEEILESMDNIGDVLVTRSAVNKKYGGYTWSITFLRDKDVPSTSNAAVE